MATRIDCFLLVASFVLLATGTRTEGKQVVDLTGLLPSHVCAPQKELRPSMLKLVHKDGPCTPFKNGRPMPSQSLILEQDRIRVNLLYGQIPAASPQSNVVGSEAVQLPTHFGLPLHTGNYLVTIGIGTPKRDFIVVMDTGSDVPWIQCAPCANCYPQQDAVFDPRQSSTYATYSCSSQECSKLRHRSCSNQLVCRYEVDYGDNSRTLGNFGSDTLTLGSEVVVPDFMFGCGDDNTGLINSSKVDGLIGLGRGSVSLVSQLAPKYGSVFSYCLPSSTSFSGYLTVGSGGGSPSASARYTPMLTSDRFPSFYFVKLTSINVEGQLLPVNSAAGTFIDSGTVISRLPPATYEALRGAFKQHMSQYPATTGTTLLDTCYDLRGSHSVTNLPSVALEFDGGATLELGGPGLLFYVGGLSKVCLAFASTGDANHLAIIGNVQQRTYEVIYDVANSEIGFVPQSCS